MNRVRRDFFANPELEQEWLLRNTWCDDCGKADLGMHSPEEYEEDGRIFVTGKCKVCDSPIASEVVVKQVDE